jgi:hypothetical protein
VCTDLPAPGDYDGDGYTDRAVYRQNCSTGSTWWAISHAKTAIYADDKFGGCNDIPAPGDYNGDGVSDRALYRPDCVNGSSWWAVNGRNGLAIYPNGITYGGCTDITATAN